MGIFGKKPDPGNFKKTSKKSTKNYCAANPNSNKHQFTHWRGGESEYTGEVHGPGRHHVQHCHWCGRVK